MRVSQAVCVLSFLNALSVSLSVRLSLDAGGTALDAAGNASSPTKQQTTEEPELPPERITVYLVRHGYSAWNRFQHEHVDAYNALTGGLKDAVLMPEGQDQALASTEFFREELKDVPMAQVQLAGSLLSRAFDTLLLATADVWRKWDAETVKEKEKEKKEKKEKEKETTPYKIHGIPALMEFGSVMDCARQEGCLEDTPPRLEDSSLFHSPILGLDTSIQKFYGILDPTGSTHYTSEWVDIMTDLKRTTPSGMFTKAYAPNDAQLESIQQYIQQQVENGKKRIVLGSHSNLIRSFVNFMKKSEVLDENGAVWRQNSSRSFDVFENKLHNGAVLSFDVTQQGKFSNLQIAAPGGLQRFLHPIKGRLVVYISHGEDFTTSGPYRYMRLSLGGVDKEVHFDDLLRFNGKRYFEVASEFQFLRVRLSGTPNDMAGNFGADVPLVEIVNDPAQSKCLPVEIKKIEAGRVAKTAEKEGNMIMTFTLVQTSHWSK